jgi:hypothetical protein
MPDIKKTYDPKKILQENNFRNIKEHHFSTAEYFNQNEALEYIQTMSIWNLVPIEKRRVGFNRFRAHFSNFADTNGLIERKLDIVVVSGVVSTSQK